MNDISEKQKQMISDTFQQICQLYGDQIVRLNKSTLKALLGMVTNIDFLELVCNPKKYRAQS